MKMTRQEAIAFRRGVLAVREALLIHGRDGMNGMFETAEKDLRELGSLPKPGPEDPAQRTT